MSKGRNLGVFFLPGIGKPCFMLALLYILFSYTKINGQEFKLKNIQKIQIPEQFLTKPQWNNTGEKILVTSEHNRGVFALDIKERKLDTLSLKNKIGRNAFWTNKNIVAILKKGTPQVLSGTKNTLKELTDTIVYIDTKSKHIFKLESGTGSRTQLTEKPALYYLPKISPDGNYLFYHLKSSIYIQCLNEAMEPVLVGTGIASSWHPNSKYIFLFKDLSNDGHQITSSELYYYSLQKNKIYKLTETIDRLEMWPCISPDGKNIVYSDEKTGEIYIAEITEK